MRIIENKEITLKINKNAHHQLYVNIRQTIGIIASTFSTTEFETIEIG